MSTHFRTANSALEIRAAGVADTYMIVDVHLQSFPAFFLSLLGRRFLTLLYEQMRRDNESVVLVAASPHGIEGFVAGVLQQDSFYRRLIERKKWSFAFAALAAATQRPAIIPRLIRALKRPAESQQSSAKACLMSIAVRPEAAGQGIGQQLVKAFCAELAACGVAAVCLTTDRDQNERVNRFYRQLGFQLSSTFVTPEGREMNEYVISLPMKDAHA
jgi:ribosomal protein S18 acetylase RimI-like enzyme